MARSRLLAAALEVALCVALCVALAAWFFDPLRLPTPLGRLSVGWGWRPLAAVAVLVMARALLRPPLEERPRMLPRVALVLAGALFPLASVEAALALAGVPAGQPVFTVEGHDGKKLGGFNAIVTDSDLIWRFEPGASFRGRRVNALGFLGREVSAEKPPGVKRVISLGDSCTAQGSPPYSAYLNELLQEDSPDGGRWEAFNAGVHGYSVVQGLRLFQTRVCGWKPDVVTVFFGWNDHWLSDQTDEVRLSRVEPAVEAVVLNGLVKKRLYTLLASRPAGSKGAEQLRVPPEEYGADLRTLIRSIRSCGAEPLVITAPRARSLSRVLVHAHQARSVEEAAELHDRYVSLTRAVAEAERAPLLDLAKRFEGRGRDVFSADGIHYTQQGLREIAEAIHERIAAREPAS